MGDVAVVAGVGAGLGWALARRFAREGLTVLAAARNLGKLEALHAADPVPGIIPMACDVADANAVAALFAAAADKGTVRLAVHNAGAFTVKPVAELDPAQVQREWQVVCLGGFHVAQQAVRRMQPEGRGTILFTGATAALRGGANFAAFAISKFGLRALAQSLAREVGPQGIHVAHVIVDGLIKGERSDGFGGDKGPDGRLDPDAIADAYWSLHMQHRSAWTQELDLRPWSERF